MMTRYWRWLVRRIAVALALVLLAGGPITAPALAQNERPDLAVEVLGLKAGSLREVRVRVTNVGQWWADRTSVTVETVAPTAGNKVTQQVPDLGPKGDKDTASEYEFTYTLAADCDGHAVKASLAAAKTFNGNSEANLANNTDGPEKLCTPKSNPSTKTGGILTSPVGDVAQADPPKRESDTKIDTDLILRPAHMQPGQHTLTFEPSAALAKLIRTRAGVCPQAASDRPGLVVGFYQQEDNCVFPPSQAYIVEVAQSAVRFDLGEVDAIPFDKRIERALLTYAETPLRSVDCVATIAKATTDWAGQPVEGLFPNDPSSVDQLKLPTVVQGGVSTGGWDVSTDVRHQVNHPDEPQHRLGYVLRGSEEDPQGDDDTSCISTLSNVRLTVTYRVTR